MGDDSRVPPLSQRVPGGSGGPRPVTRLMPPVLTESVVQRVRAAIDVSREQEQAATRERAVPHEQAPPPEQATHLAGPSAASSRLAGADTGPVPPAQTVVPPAQTVESAHPASPWFPADPDDDTQPFAAIPSSAIPSSAGSDQVNPAGDMISVQPEREAWRHTAVPPAQSKPAAARRGLAEKPRRPSAPKAPPRRRRRMVGVFLSVVVLLTAGLLAYTLSRHTATDKAGNVHRVVAAPDQVTRNLAASWVASQVSRAAIVSCDPVMCQALRAHGVPAASLLELSPGRTNPLRSEIIVATQVVRGQLGSRLDSVYAPAVIASMGSGNLRIDIRAVAPHGAAAYLSAVNADVLARKAAAVTLLHSQRIELSAIARTQLADGQVDSRLLVTIAGLAAIHPVSILAFGDAAAGASPGIPLRSADLAAADGAAGMRSSAYVRSMVGFLHARPAPYLPAQIKTVRRAGGQAALRIEFAAPSPLGLLAPPA